VEPGDQSLLFVGESNPYGEQDGKFALYHLPRGASGNNLRKHLGLMDSTYAALDKVNLCVGPWRLEAARAKAMILLTEYRVIVLLGVKVRKAFGGPAAWEARRSAFGRSWVSLPHPSGLNAAWRELGASERARALLREHAPWIPWGEEP
jgi:hypothetical protein